MAEREQELTDFTLEELEEEARPLGKNDLSAFAMFFQRKKYKEKSRKTQPWKSRRTQKMKNLMI